jgi:hypothetical protein
VPFFALAVLMLKLCHNIEVMMSMHGKFYKPTRFYHQILCLRILIFRVAYGIDRILAPEPGRGVPSALRISRIWHILKILMPTRAIPQNIQILDILDILEWSGRVGRAAGAALAPLGRQNMAESTGF